VTLPITAPTATSTYNIYIDKLYTGFIFREALQSWILASTATNPAAFDPLNPSNPINNSDYTLQDLRLRNIVVEGEISGSIVGFKTTTTAGFAETVGTAQTIPGLTNLRGSGQVIVTGPNDGNASAIFNVSKSFINEAGQIQRISSSGSTSSTSAELDLQWNATEPIKVLHSTTGSGVAAIEYKVTYMIA
jgi:hypothetical protein